MKVKSEREMAQLYLTLSDPMDCSLPDSSIHGIFQTRVLEWGAIAFSGAVLSRSVIKTLTLFDFLDSLALNMCNPWSAIHQALFFFFFLIFI